MRKFSFIISILLFSLSTTLVIAQDDTAKDPEISSNDASAVAQESVLHPGIVNCFDYYKFGSVQVPVSSEVSNVASGSTLFLTGTIQNSNAYPIVWGKVVVKIYKRQLEMNANGPYVVDQFTAKENISIDANSIQQIDFTWTVPAYATSGDYQVVTFFTSENKFNLLGLTFTDDIIGNAFDFKVTGEQKTLVEFDKNSVQINGKPYLFAAFPPRVDTAQNGVITADIVNETDESQSALVTWKTYRWDAQREENILDTKKEVIQLTKGETKTLSYTVTDKTHPVYLIMAEVEYKDTKSILWVRFTREGIDIPRINFPAVTSFPLTKGVQTTLFSCLHNTSSNDVANSSLSLKLEDKNGTVFHEYTYNGTITSDMMGVKDIFTPTKNYDNFSIEAVLTKDGKVIDSARMHYDCQEIDPAKCSSPSQVGSWTKTINLSMIIMVGIALILFLGVLYFVFEKRHHKIMTGIGILLVIILIILSIVLSDQKAFGAIPSPTYNPTTGVSSVLFTSSISGYLWGNAPNWQYTPVLNPGTITRVTYRVGVSDADSWVNVLSNTTVVAGKKLRFTFSEAASDDLSWNRTGSVWDSPYGHWVTSETLTSAQRAVLGCNAADAYAYLTYANLNVVVPTKILTNTGGLSCGSYTILKSPTCAYLQTESDNATACTYLGLTTTRTIGGRTSTTCSAAKVKALRAQCNATPPAGYIDCTVASTPVAATLSPTFYFAATTGRVYQSAWRGMDGVQQCWINPTPLYESSTGDSKNDGDWELRDNLPSNARRYTLNVPAQNIPYIFQVTPTPSTNQPPTPPVITGPTTGSVQTWYTFNFRSTDPDVPPDTIKYIIDWNNDGTALQTIPGTGFVPSGTLQSANKSWSTGGPHTFRARAEDEHGLQSNWSSHTITLSMNYTLTLTKAGNGNGTVTGAGSYSPGIIVTLTNTPGANSTFAGWSWDPDCIDGIVTMNSDKICIATFNLTTINATCSPSPTSTTPNQPITWTATNILGGTGTYSFSWSWTDGLTGTTNPLSKTYTAVWTKNASVIITSGNQTATVSCTTAAITTLNDMCANMEDTQTTVPVGLNHIAGNCVCGN